MALIFLPITRVLRPAAGAGADALPTLGEGWEELRSELPLDLLGQRRGSCGISALRSFLVGRTRWWIRTWCWGGGVEQLCRLGWLLWVTSQLGAVESWL